MYCEMEMQAEAQQLLQAEEQLLMLISGIQTDKLQQQQPD